MHVFEKGRSAVWSLFESYESQEVAGVLVASESLLAKREHLDLHCMPLLLGIGLEIADGSSSSKLMRDLNRTLRISVP